MCVRDVAFIERKKRILCIISLIATTVSAASAQVHQPSPWQLQFQPNDSDVADTPTHQQQRPLPHQPQPQPQIVQNLAQPQQLQLQPTQQQLLQQQLQQQHQQLAAVSTQRSPIFGNQPEAAHNAFQSLPLELTRPQLSSTKISPTVVLPEEQSLSLLPLGLHRQPVPYLQNLQQHPYNFNELPQPENPSLEPKSQISDFQTSFAPPAPIPSPPSQTSNAVFAQPQNQLQYTEELQRKLQLQLQLTQQIQQQIEQLQKLQDLQRQALAQQKRLLDEGKALESEQRSAPQVQQPRFQYSEDLPNQQRFVADGQDLLNQHSLLPQSSIADFQFASPGNTLRRHQALLASQLVLENSTDPSVPYYLVAPSINSVSFFDQIRNGGVEGRNILSHLLDITTSVNDVSTVTPSSAFSDSATSATSNDIQTATEVSSSAETSERYTPTTSTSVDRPTTSAPSQNAQRSSQGEVITNARKQIQFSRTFIARQE